jgi:hypothetical protein
LPASSPSLPQRSGVMTWSVRREKWESEKRARLPQWFRFTRLRSCHNSRFSAFPASLLELGASPTRWTPGEDYIGGRGGFGTGYPRSHTLRGNALPATLCIARFDAEPREEAGVSRGFPRVPRPLKAELCCPNPEPSEGPRSPHGPRESARQRAPGCRGPRRGRASRALRPRPNYRARQRP